MTLLVISPDYASHVLPLATLATAWRRAGDRVVFATGPATHSVVTAFGYERCDLSLGRGSNPGVIRVEQQQPGEDEALRGFFEATRRGMVETLRYQADARGSDLLWEPVARAGEVLRIVDRVRPDHVLVDHLAFSARLGLTTAGVPHGDVVLGHPTALPVGAEVYGYPVSWPAAFRPEPDALAALHERCRAVRDEFTDRWNAAAAALGSAETVPDAFAAHGDAVLLNYPALLHDPARTAMLPFGHTFLGSAVRDEKAPADVRRWLDVDSRDPVVYVSLGSFLSARGDVLARLVEALRPLPVRVALAAGSTDPGSLGDVPPTWLLREHLPQVAVLRRAAVAVTHGGNNSVTEALACGVPMVLLPFSTDQFAGAAAVERSGLGEALDPNAAGPAELRGAVGRVLTGDGRLAAQALAGMLRAHPGPELARAAVPPA
ncbi:MAG TPA: glycosyltransferase [Jiangellales bacterium]|nr:glycosyltransferase [Jiangellales bacterium]